jgi:hypothetical protein
MGSLTDALHIKPETADNIAKVILGYLLASSYALLFWKWRRRQQPISSLADAKAGDTTSLPVSPDRKGA